MNPRLARLLNIGVRDRQHSDNRKAESLTDIVKTRVRINGRELVRVHNDLVSSLFGGTADGDLFFTPEDAELMQTAVDIDKVVGRPVAAQFAGFIIGEGLALPVSEVEVVSEEEVAA